MFAGQSLQGGRLWGVFFLARSRPEAFNGLSDRVLHRHHASFVSVEVWIAFGMGLGFGSWLLSRH